MPEKLRGVHSQVWAEAADRTGGSPGRHSAPERYRVATEPAQDPFCPESLLLSLPMVFPAVSTAEPMQFQKSKLVSLLLPAHWQNNTQSWDSGVTGDVWGEKYCACKLRWFCFDFKQCKWHASSWRKVTKITSLWSVSKLNGLGQLPGPRLSCEQRKFLVFTEGSGMWPLRWNII